MKKTSALRLTQAAMIAAIYVVLTYFISAFGLANGAIQVRIFRGSDYLTDLYAGSDSGTFCWMFAQQHLDRMHGTRRGIWQSGNPDRCDWHLSFKKDQVCLYLAAGDR